MILCDVNLLVYAYDSSSPFHSDAKKWWEETVRSGKAIGLPWEVTSGFLRLVTHPKVFARPLAVDRALDIVNSWFEQPNVTPLNPGPRHWQHFSELLRSVQVGGKLTADAHLAAIAIEYRAELVTNDRDFERFSGFALFNPLGTKPRLGRPPKAR